MRYPRTPLWACVAVFLVLSALLASGCVTVPNYMKMNPPPDSDKPLPVPAGDNSCWLHTASNMLAGAGFGTGTTVQARADDIFADMSANFGIANTGWIDTALNWWLGSANNTWTANPYTVVTVYGNKTKVPWANANGAQDIGNTLRTCDMVGLSISWPSGSGGYGGHAITGWGDTALTSDTLTSNPAGIRITDSDTDAGGDVQAYSYDAYTNPNPGGANEGNGWYFDYGSSTPHAFIKHISTLAPTSGAFGRNAVRVTGSYQIHQAHEMPATDLHYWVGTDVEILSYRTWLDWWPEGAPEITEDSPRRGLTVDWDLTDEKNQVPVSSTVTIYAEFVEPNWNAIGFSDVRFTYPDEGYRFPDLAWTMETPLIDGADKIPNVTGGYVLGSFDVIDPENPERPAVRYRFVHQYLYTQSPELHTLLITGTPEFVITNLLLGHTYGYPIGSELWRFEDWMTKVDEEYRLDSSEPARIAIDWTGRLPYPEGDADSGQKQHD
jgi:hypothetical protein